MGDLEISEEAEICWSSRNGRFVCESFRKSFDEVGHVFWVGLIRNRRVYVRGLELRSRRSFMFTRVKHL
jgi:hypothetical protein